MDDDKPDDETSDDKLVEHVRTDFSAAEIELVDRSRGGTPRGTWVRDRLMRVVEGEIPLHPWRVDHTPIRDRTRVAFRLTAAQLVKIDAARELATRAQWIRYVVIRSIPGAENSEKEPSAA